MADEKEVGGWFGWIAAAVVASVVAVVGFMQGWFDNLLGSNEYGSSTIMLWRLQAQRLVNDLRGDTTAKDINKFKMLGIAAQNYYTHHDHFAANVKEGELKQDGSPDESKADDKAKDKKAVGGKSQLSWRVQLLPYMEQTELYNKFHHDEPWDSAHNKALITQMPDVFAIGGNKEAAARGETFIQTIQGGDGKGCSAFLPANNKDRVMRDITDGSSNTIMFAEAANAVIWTKPDDLSLTSDALPNVGAHGSDKIKVGFADGNVRLLPANLDPNVLKAITTVNGGEVVPSDQLFSPPRRVPETPSGDKSL